MIIKININGFAFEFETSQRCFCPENIDRGTLAMLSCAELKAGQKILDLGCGYGAVGIIAAKIVGSTNVFILDIDQEAVYFSLKNAKRNGTKGIKIIQSDGFLNLDESEFDLILSNPPYHTDFSVAKKFIEKGFNRLKIGGKLLMVTKRKDWYKNKLISIFGGTNIRNIDGYFIFEVERRTKNYVNKKG
jgi:16S rRNA (guanine1207-N2)-methyltransferase